MTRCRLAPIVGARLVGGGFVGARRARDRGQGPLLQALDVRVGFVEVRLARDGVVADRGQGPLLQA